MNEKIALLNTITTVQDNYRNLKTSVNETCDPEMREEIIKKTIKKKVPKDLYLKRTGEKVFLDNMKLMELEEEVGVPVRVAYGAEDLRELLQGWR